MRVGVGKGRRNPHRKLNKTRKGRRARRRGVVVSRRQGEDGSRRRDCYMLQREFL